MTMLHPGRSLFAGRMTLNPQELIDRLLPGARVRGCERLTGGVPAEVLAVTVRPPVGPVEHLVIRRHCNIDGKADRRDRAAREHALLTHLHAASAPVPQLRLFVLLWHEGRLVAVLDWEDTAIGDPLADVACARVELECAAGDEMAKAFSRAYFERTGADDTRLPAWGLYVSTSALQYMDSWGLARDALAGP